MLLVSVGMVVAGLGYAIYGLYHTLVNAETRELRKKLAWRLGAGIVLTVAFGTAFALAVDMPRALTMDVPDSSYIRLIVDGSDEGVEGDTTFRGKVVNTHPEWSIQDVRIDLDIYSYGTSVPYRTYHPQTTPLRIGPGETGEFLVADNLRLGTIRYHAAAEWEWEPP